MKVTLIVAALLAMTYVVAVGILAWQQRRLLYFPDVSPPVLPDPGVVAAEEITVGTADGLALLAWLAPPADAAQPVVLYLHGNGGHIGYRALRLALLSRLGWGVLMLEYRGFGGNPGTPTEAGLIEDACAGYRALLQRGIAPRRIVLWGESLGTGVAVRLATDVQVGAVLLESPYTSIAAIAWQRYPVVPVDWILRDRFDLIGRIGAVHVPVLVMTGGLDRIVPPAMGRAVFAAANEPKVFWFAETAGHNDLREAGALDAARAFIRDYWKAGS